MLVASSCASGAVGASYRLPPVLVEQGSTLGRRWACCIYKIYSAYIGICYMLFRGLLRGGVLLAVIYSASD